MNTTVYKCPECHRPWHRTDADWEFTSGRGQHFKNAEQATCPECAARRRHQ